MQSRIRIADDRARSALLIRCDGVYLDTQLTQRFSDVLSILPADKARQDNVAAELPVNACGVTALAAWLSQGLTAALNLSGLEMIDLKDAIDGEVGTDD